MVVNSLRMFLGWDLSFRLCNLPSRILPFLFQMELELGHLIECLAAFQARQRLIKQTMSSRESLSLYQQPDSHFDEG